MMTRQTCKSCVNWYNATADCSRQIYYDANNLDVPKDIETALARDSNIDNDCNEYRLCVYTTHDLALMIEKYESEIAPGYETLLFAGVLTRIGMTTKFMLSIPPEPVEEEVYDYWVASYEAYKCDFPCA